MKNLQICGNCGEKNPFYALDCNNCHSFLRSKVPNIDLWQTIWGILEKPVEVSKKIILSEHKNFLVSLLVLIFFQFSIFTVRFYNAFLEKGKTQISVLRDGIWLGGLPVVLFIILFSVLITILNRLLGLKNRPLDNISIYTFCFIPSLLGMLVLIPIQFALFGEYWFTFNPSPFIIKPAATYILLSVEGILYIWSAIISIFATYAQTLSKSYSIMIGLIFFTLVSSWTLYFSHLF